MLAETGTVQQRIRLLPAWAVVYFVFAWSRSTRAPIGWYGASQAWACRAAGGASALLSVLPGSSPARCAAAEGLVRCPVQGRRPGAKYLVCTGRAAHGRVRRHRPAAV
ncbi:hypothetical protein ACMATS_37655 [Streptoverticillium reticulum]|uniref:hypothetical protein n=1 Tax=Streptoverticillium reticulum TaxID=1433415 RepID=UPI0039BFEF06